MRDIIRTIAAAAVALGLAAAPAAADQLADIKERGTLVVGVKNDYKPWGFSRAASISSSRPWATPRSAARS
jgi:ABC-type amino acid transport substrate-binding protein